MPSTTADIGDKESSGTKAIDIIVACAVIVVFVVLLYVVVTRGVRF